MSNELNITFQQDLVVPSPRLYQTSSTVISSKIGFSSSPSKAAQNYGREVNGNRYGEVKKGMVEGKELSLIFQFDISQSNKLRH